mmetsp:Transcript_91214/g.258298  ORF Transcript_91214/g.258298 Transcript_91214/m.258298 type:complete len:201 (-) Transcript_91214:1555-2157(-)
MGSGPGACDGATADAVAGAVPAAAADGAASTPSAVAETAASAAAGPVPCCAAMSAATFFCAASATTLRMRPMSVMRGLGPVMGPSSMSFSWSSGLRPRRASSARPSSPLAFTNCRTLSFWSDPGAAADGTAADGLGSPVPSGASAPEASVSAFAPSLLLGSLVAPSTEDASRSLFGSAWPSLVCTAPAGVLPSGSSGRVP